MRTKSRIEKKREELPDEIPMKCPNCGYEWDYSGKNPFFCTCPTCYNQKIEIQENRTDLKENIEKKNIDLLEELKKMELGDMLEVERIEKRNLVFSKTYINVDESLTRYTPIHKVDIGISLAERGLIKGTLKKPIYLTFEDLEKIKKRAEGEDKTLLEKLNEKVDMREGKIEKLTNWLRDVTQENKKLDEYAEGDQVIEDD